MTNPMPFAESQDFLIWLAGWMKSWPSLRADEFFTEPERVAIVSVDVINGFCVSGALSSPRVGRIAAPIAALFERAWGRGVRHILLTQDTHEPDAVEFAQFPPHCVRGTPEAEPVDEFKRLPFFAQMQQMPKNSIHSGLNTALVDWIASHPEVDRYVVVGDCTDLCTYQLAMHLRLDANARQLSRRVVLPENCVDTYDMPVQLAAQLGSFPHDGDLLHAVFLYSMALNGVEVVTDIR